MSGKPAARQGDATKKGGPIIEGAATVLIGATGGVACSTCPGGMAIGSPVNPALGAKVLSGADELDFALPGPLPLVWQRQYSSYVNAEHGASCGLLGYGWKLPMETIVHLQDEQSVLFDAGGRAITFHEPLPIGGALYSDSEDLWLLRGGTTPPVSPGQGPAELQPWSEQPRWAHVPPQVRADPACVIAASGTGAGATLWLLWPGADGRHRPALVVDRYGRHQRHTHDEHGRLVQITDGSGRHYALRYNKSGPRNAPTRPTSTSPSSPAPWLGPDDGERLIGVDCIVQTPGAAAAPPIHLVRYRYDAAGNLAEVLGRDGTLVRSFSYDPLHRMTAHRVRQGPLHRYVYEDQNKDQGRTPRPGARVTEQHNEEGLSYFFSYQDAAPADAAQPARSQVTVRDSLQRSTVYQFEGAGGLKRLVRLIQPDGSAEQHRYDGAGRRSASTDALGRSTWWRYDGQGRLLGLQLPDGRSSHQHWGAPGSAEDGLLLEGVDAAGLRTSYSYDAWGRLVAQSLHATDGSVLVNRFEYAQSQDGRFVPAVLPWCEHPIATIDAQGGCKQLAYDDNGQLVRYTDCSNQSQTWRYGPWGELLEETDALGQRTQHAYDQSGRRTYTRHPDGQQVHYRHGPNGELQAIQSGGSHNDTPAVTLTYAHDLWGRVTAQTQAGRSVVLRYDLAGRLIALVNENQDITQFSYDMRDRLVQEIGFDGRSQVFGYDAAGQLVAKRDSHADSHHPGAMQGDRSTVDSRYHYNQAGRLWARLMLKQPQDGAPTLLSHCLEHDTQGAMATARGWSAELADPAQAERWLAMDSAALAQALNTEGLQPETCVELQRDAFGRACGEVQTLYHQSPAPGSAVATAFEHTIAHRLGALGQRLASRLQDVGELQWLSYGSGHVHGVLLGQQPLVDIERDALHREVARRLYVYGAAGETQPVVQQRRLDPMGRLLQQHWQGLQAPEEAQEAKDLLDTVRQRRYTYDALGLLVQVQTLADTTHYGYDAWQRLVASRSIDAQGDRSQRWWLDPAGNRLPAPTAPASQTTPQDWAAQVRSHLHDPRFDLLQPDGARAHTANVTHWPGNRIGFSRDEDGASTHYRYDAFGNRVQTAHPDGRIQWLGYDALHQLIEVEEQRPGGARRLVARYRYDAFGRRVAKTVWDGENEATSHHGWDGDRLVHEQDKDGILHTVYEPDSFVPMLQFTGAKAQPDPLRAIPGNEAAQALFQGLPQEQRNRLRAQIFAATDQEHAKDAVAEVIKEIGQGCAVIVGHALSDHLGMPISLIAGNGRNAGQLTWIASHSAWGGVQEEYRSCSKPLKIRLQGQCFDAESGLSYNRFRYYDSGVGGYATQDPIGLFGGINHTVYPVNPQGWTDPLGLNPVLIGVCTAAAGIGYSLYKFFKKSDEALQSCVNAANKKKALEDWAARGAIGPPPSTQAEVGEAIGNCAENGAEAAVEGAKISSKPVTSTGSILGKVLK